MSDTPQGPGWWQAADGRWHPPAGSPPPPPPAPPGGPGYGPPPAPGGFGPPPAPGGFGPPPGYGPAGYGSAPPLRSGSYASWGSRVGATLLDAVFTLPAYLLYFIGAAADSAALVVVGALLGGAAALYFAFLTGAKGQSPGKAVVGIKVVNEASGEPIGGGLGIGRAFVHIIDGLPCYLGYLWPLWDAKRQTFTDKVLNTIVHDMPKQGISAGIFKP